jgi:hypothetical protein
MQTRHYIARNCLSSLAFNLRNLTLAAAPCIATTWIWSLSRIPLSLSLSVYTETWVPQLDSNAAKVHSILNAELSRIRE